MREAFPDRADAILRVVDRWLWWNVPLPYDFPPRTDACLLCARALPLTMHRERPDDHWDPRMPFGLCLSCNTLLRELPDCARDESVLADLARAIPEHEFGELSAAAALSEERTPKQNGSFCDSCNGRDPGQWQIGNSTICFNCGTACLSNDKGAPPRIAARAIYG